MIRVGSAALIAALSMFVTAFGLLAPARGTAQSGACVDTGLQAALTAASAGDTVTVCDGTYELAEPLKVPAGVTLAGESRAGVVLRQLTNLAAPRNGGGVVHAEGADGARITRLSVRGPDDADQHTGIWVMNSDGVRIDDVDVRDFARTGLGYGVLPNGAVDGLIVEDSYFEHNRHGVTTARDAAITGFVIRRNTFVNHTDAPIDNHRGAEGTRVIDNTIVQGPDSGSDSGSETDDGPDGIILQGLVDFVVEGNTIDLGPPNRGRHGIFIQFIAGSRHTEVRGAIRDNTITNLGNPTVRNAVGVYVSVSMDTETPPHVTSQRVELRGNTVSWTSPDGPVPGSSAFLWRRRAGGPVVAFVDERDDTSVPDTTLLYGYPLTVDRADVAFGARGVDAGPTASAAVTVTSTAIGSVTPGAASVAGTDAGEFAITSDTCAGAPLAPGGTCTVAVAFDPAGTGAAAATLEIPTSDPFPAAAVPLTGIGTSPPPPPPAPVATPAAAPPVASAVAVVRCAGRRATIVGTPGPDRLRGTPGPDVIASLGGNDVVLGRGGGDRICLGPGADRAAGGGGADRIFGQAGNDRVLGNAADDRLDGGAGNDTLRGLAGNDLAFGRAGRDTLQGGTGRDLLRGGTGNDRIFGQAGNDRLFGQGGRDLASGGTGRDLARGGTGADRLLGGSGRDRLFGERGNDRLSGGTGLDRANGGPGADRCASEVAILC